MKLKSTLRLDFVDFNGLNKVDNWFTRILAQDFKVEISDRPDLLIYQEGGHLNRLYTCKKLFWTGESILPDWNQTDYAMTCFYMEDPRHLRFPYYVWGSEALPEMLIKRPGEAEIIFAQRRKFCAAVVSNSNQKRSGYRIDFLRKLMQRKQVDSGGRLFNNFGPIPLGGQPKHRFISQYKFNFCFENKNLPGYTTEKIADAMWAKTVPIYWGNERIGEEFNKKSFLHRLDYPSDEAFIDKIIEIDSDDEKYLEILSEPFFHNNQPNIFYDENRIREFIKKALDSADPPVSRRRRFFSFGRWKLAKRQHF
jgi:hypothetical protein